MTNSQLHGLNIRQTTGYRDNLLSNRFEYT